MSTNAYKFPLHDTNVNDVQDTHDLFS